MVGGWNLLAPPPRKYAIGLVTKYVYLRKAVGMLYNSSILIF